MPRRFKILVVEDSPTMLGLYRMVLGGETGAEMVVARDGLEGLDRAAVEQGLDLCIVDINMPRMDGLEFLRRLRNELRLDVPALVVSTERSPEDRRAALDAGATDYASKPLTPGELRRRVEALMIGGGTP